MQPGPLRNIKFHPAVQFYNQISLKDCTRNTGRAEEQKKPAQPKEEEPAKKEEMKNTLFNAQSMPLIPKKVIIKIILKKKKCYVNFLFFLKKKPAQTVQFFLQNLRNKIMLDKKDTFYHYITK
ncbi:MAG: hypothetical protein D3908_03550 [Candidatus Electrothrix sp. AUS4]|nr:hypothetical protein [Candidatus Electrothrix sp. AUS4]